MTGEVQLRTGREITVSEFRQLSTYEGQLEGLPTKEKNERLLQRLSNDETLASYGVPLAVLPPTESLIELPPDYEYPFGTPAALPSVMVVARFTSMSPTNKGEGDASGLTVAWFQEGFSWPPPAEVLSQLEALDWEHLAGNFEY